MLDFSVTFVITIVNIAILFFILRAILFKPVTKFMAERAKRIQDSIEQSEKDKNQAKALFAQYEAQLKTAETEAEAIINSAREHAREEAEKIIAEGRISAEAAMASARKQLETEHEAALTLFREQAAALVVAASGRRGGREMQSGDNRQNADILLAELSPPEPGKN
jgi:F-type H+-transporting ATPase subunit b